MPIHRMNLENGVFSARQVGYFDHVDARMWANALSNYADTSDSPLMAVMDVSEVDRICPTTMKVFSSLASNGNLVGIALVTGSAMVSRNAKMLEKLATLAGVRVFTTYEEAMRHAKTQLNPTFGSYTLQSVLLAAG